MIHTNNTIKTDYKEIKTGIEEEKTKGKYIFIKVKRLRFIWKVMLICVLRMVHIKYLMKNF